jgi:hypothetical protein
VQGKVQQNDDIDGVNFKFLLRSKKYVRNYLKPCASCETPFPKLRIIRPRDGCRLSHIREFGGQKRHIQLKHEKW